jgi:microsomal dipeptidase-like Zn-dependent dipeptidase
VGNGLADQVGDADLAAHGESGTGNFAVVGVPADVAVLLDQGVAAGGGWVIGENVQRVFAGMKTGLAGGDRAGVEVRAADLELMAAAAERGIEALVGHKGVGVGAEFLVWHCSPPLVVPPAVLPDHLGTIRTRGPVRAAWIGDGSKASFTREVKHTFVLRAAAASG